MSCLAYVALAADGKYGLPRAVSGYEGWHGAHIDKHNMPMCELILPRGFGRQPEEFRLLLEMAHHGWDVSNDMGCAMQMGPEAAWKQILLLAVEDQNPAAAKVIVGGMEHTEQLGVDSDYATSFGEHYLYPLLLRYHDLAGLVPRHEEKNLARDVCATYFSPRTSEHLDLDGVKKRLKQKRMRSLLLLVNTTCARMANQG